MQWRLAAIFITIAIAGVLATDPVHAAPKDDIGDTFARFLAAQNDHDLDAVEELLSDSREFIWIAPGSTVRGRDAALSRFRELFQGTWRIDPNWLTFQILMLDAWTAEIFVRISITSDAPPRAELMNQILVNTENGWRVLCILASELPPT
jgi:SnoaL-like domain